MRRPRRHDGRQDRQGCHTDCRQRFRQTAPTRAVADPARWSFSARRRSHHRLLLPALYNLGVSGLLPRPSLWSASRAANTSAAFRDDLAKSLPKIRDAPSRRACGKPASRLRRLSCKAIPTTTTTSELGQSLPASSGERGTRATGCSISRRRRAASRPIGARSARPGWRARRTAPGGASSSKSRSAPTSRRRARSTRATRHPRGRPDFPHRSLPRQGDGAEHPGAALRQRLVRADLEPRAYRPRADHRGRERRVGRRGNFYEQTGALRDMVPEPSVPASLADRPWSRRSRFDAERARRKGATPRRGPSLTRDEASPMRCARNRWRATSATSRSPTIAPSKDVDAEQHDGNLRRAAN